MSAVEHLEHSVEDHGHADERGAFMTAGRFAQTSLWRDALGMPAALARTLNEREGFGAVTSLIEREGTRRVVLTGNGAAFYVALAASTLSWSLPETGPQWLAVPAGLLLSRDFRLRQDDLLLVVSSSGELKDVLVSGALERPFALVTSNPNSSIGRRAAAVARAHVLTQTAVTHTQGYLSNLAVVIALLASSRHSTDLEAALLKSAAGCAAALERAESWANALTLEVDARAAIVAASGPGYAAALEAALLLKEVAGIFAEGLEAREAATSGMYALGRGALMLALGHESDSILEETCRVCGSRGALVCRAPIDELATAGLLGITSFPCALALAVRLGLARGLNVDRPDWADAYYKTAR